MVITGDLNPEAQHPPVRDSDPSGMASLLPRAVAAGIDDRVDDERSLLAKEEAEDATAAAADGAAPARALSYDSVDVGQSVVQREKDIRRRLRGLTYMAISSFLFSTMSLSANVRAMP
jgi:hypothetical protein